MTKLTTIACVLAVGSGVASADNKTKADELFKQAKKLMAEKRFSEACPKFEDSYKLDPGIGGELNIGKCYEEWGKLGRAYRAYVDAEKQAKAASDNREAKIHELVVAIEPQVPRLTIHVPADADTDGLKVAIDGVDVGTEELAKPQLVDPGPKNVEYSTTAQPKRSKLVPVERGGTSDITLELPKRKTTPVVDHDKDKDHPVVAAESPGHTQRIAGIAVGGAGVVLIGVASVITLSARSKYNDALAMHCMNMTNMCDGQGLTDTHDARHTANIATVVGAVGVAAVVGGVVMYVIAPKAAAGGEHAYYLVPALTNESAGFAFGGRL
jgi:serine/threonine-protein kinase